jgi:hypothetical protein
MTAAAPSFRDAYQFVLGNALSEQEQKLLAASFSAVSMTLDVLVYAPSGTSRFSNSVGQQDSSCAAGQQGCTTVPTSSIRKLSHNVLAHFRPLSTAAKAASGGSNHVQQLAAGQQAAATCA